MRRLVSAALAAAALGLVPAAASAGPDPVCQMHWDKPTVSYDENGLPKYVTVERPYFVC
ncbi:MAG TPA: hypothetical protein VF519_05665 [Mycobacteriales bacterium]